MYYDGVGQPAIIVDVELVVGDIGSRLTTIDDSDEVGARVEIVVDLGSTDIRIVVTVRSSDNNLVVLERSGQRRVSGIGDNSSANDIESEHAGVGIVALDVETTRLEEFERLRLYDCDSLGAEAYVVAISHIDGVEAGAESCDVQRTYVSSLLDEVALAG